jgi:hypothetical protein
MPGDALQSDDRKPRAAKERRTSQFQSALFDYSTPALYFAETILWKKFFPVIPIFLLCALESESKYFARINYYKYGKRSQKSEN